jgi:pimeloyl-ACP methyl ester carboxylesterase
MSLVMDYVLHMMANPILFKPPTRPTGCKFSGDAKNVSVRALSGDEIHCQLVCPWDSQSNVHNYVPTKKMLLYLHGNNEDIQTSASYRQWISNNININVLTCDYPGYGFSSGDPSEEGMHHAALAMLDLATSRLKHSPADIIVIGKSIGSTPAIGLAVNSYCHDLCGLILLSPVASGVRCLSLSTRLPKYIVAQLDGLVLPNIRYIGQVMCPVQFVHGLQDDMVPCSNSQALIDAYAKHLYTEPVFVDAGHNDIESRHTATFLDTIRDFVEVCTQRSQVTVPYDISQSFL